MTRRWYADRAWLGHVADRVLFEVEDGRLTGVTADVDAPADARRLPGLVLPGLANVHSHAFHRALRGRTEAAEGTFWTWRERMFEVAAALDPDRYLTLARATYAEMALAGITAVGEFHYLHHQSDGTPYADPNAMGEALLAAAAEAGVRLTLLDTCYLRAGFHDQPLSPTQRRFSDGAADAWAARAAARPTADHARLGAAIHSVRATPPDAIETVATWAADRDAPLHVHVSEQPAENEACLAATGRTPTRLLADHGALGPRTTAVHATHLTTEDIGLLGTSGATVCLCPTTERSLADGIGPAAALRDAGSPLAVGSDSHAVIDPFEEARAIELDERLATGTRGRHRPQDLLRAATEDGMTALGWDAGRLAAGAIADLVAIDTTSPRLAGARPADLAAHVVFAATASDVTHVVAGGRPIVEDRRHVAIDDVGRALADAIGSLTP